MADDGNGFGRAAAKVDEARLWQRHVDMARLGGTPRGGVRRLALDANDIQARALLAEWARPYGWAVAMDDIGNLFIRRPGSDAAAEPVLSGSHTDTQPSGGRFDGIYGVLAAFEAMEAMEAAGIRTRRPVEAVVWTCEEGGARFPMGTMGSGVFVGRTPLEKARAVADYDGITVGAALDAARAALPGVAHRPIGSPIAGYVEAHIEQGPILEEKGLQIGVVTGIQGSRRFLVEVEGADAHAGTTPRARRRDALSAAVAMVGALERLFHDDPSDTVRFTVGRFVVTPNAPAVVPGHVAFTIDFRNPEPEILRRLGDQVDPICQANRGQCTVIVTQTSGGAPVHFADRVPDAVEAAARGLRLGHMRIFSGAGHDAGPLHAVAPSGMIFVPCEKGISHAEAENATPADLAAGTRVLAETLVDLAR
ncbi:MAG: M20 family metallo-hydrolase [Alphaproteobacteria bacterium]|nr:M20 family metallo-hydrolase [Alphaproteobacteria bacterium]